MAKTSVVPAYLETNFVEKHRQEVVIKRWEGTCTEPGYNKWWAIVLVQRPGGLYVLRSANGSLSNSSGQLHGLGSSDSRFSLERKFQSKVSEKQNLNRKRSYSYVGEHTHTEQPPIDPNNPPVKPAAQNPKIKGNLFASVMLGSNK